MLLRTINNESLLLKQLAESYEPAFRTLYDAYAESIYSVALQHLKLPHLAEDIVQSVFLKLWESRIEVTGLAHFPSWLYIIARNTIISVLRKHGTQDDYREYLKQRMDTVSANPELELIKKEQLVLIRQAVEQLSPQQRTAFQLQRDEGLSYEAIGQRMGIATNTVRVHLYKAMESIRRFIQAHGLNDVAVTFLLVFTLL